MYPAQARLLTTRSQQRRLYNCTQYVRCTLNLSSVRLSSEPTLDVRGLKWFFRENYVIRVKREQKFKVYEKLFYLKGSKWCKTLYCYEQLQDIAVLVTKVLTSFEIISDNEYSGIISDGDTISGSEQSRLWPGGWRGVGQLRLLPDLQISPHKAGASGGI